jgi:hypothetical protein
MVWLLFLRFMLVFSLLCGILLLPPFLLRRAVKVAAALILFPVSFFLLLDALIVDGIGFRGVILVPVLSLAMQGIFVWAIFRLFARPASEPTGNHATLRRGPHASSSSSWSSVLASARLRARPSLPQKFSRASSSTGLRVIIRFAHNSRTARLRASRSARRRHRIATYVLSIQQLTSSSASVRSRLSRFDRFYRISRQEHDSLQVQASIIRTPSATRQPILSRARRDTESIAAWNSFPMIVAVPLLWVNPMIPSTRDVPRPVAAALAVTSLLIVLALVALAVWALTWTFTEVR